MKMVTQFLMLVATVIRVKRGTIFILDHGLTPPILPYILYLPPRNDVTVLLFYPIEDQTVLLQFRVELIIENS